MHKPDFLLIRHGETDWNREGRLQGARDIPLNETGRQQAREAGRRASALAARRGWEFDACRFVASPLGRTTETMRLARTAMGLDPDPFDLDDRLKEFSFGRWEGDTWAEVKSREPTLVKDRRRDKWRFVPPEGESYQMLAERLRPFMVDLPDRAIIVAHGGVARALMVLVGGLSILAALNTEVVQGRVLWFRDGRCGWA